jgi:hypothetical protein
MADPVILQMQPPKTPFRLPKLPHMGPKLSNIITASAAVVICVSMVSYIGFIVFSESPQFKSKHSQLAPGPSASSGTQLSPAALPGGGTAVGTGGTTGKNSPVVTLSATPSSVSVGGRTQLKWSTTNNPTSCDASDDWSGSKGASGTQTSPPLTTVQTYLFTLTCKNATGTGFATVPVGSTSQSGTGSIGRPAVTLAANPSSVYTGENSTLVWSASNSPSSCSASGDWSGSKAASGGENTSVLSAAKQYTYTLTCKNASGTGTATATVLAKTPPANIPVVNISSSAIGPVKPGDTVSITWSSTNNPNSCTASGDWSGSKAASGNQQVGPLNTVRNYVYTLSCSNAAGSANDSVSVQVLPAAPTVALTVSPTRITQGSSATITWSSANTPTSCTASGDWSGSKAASGSASTGALNTVKTYYYSLSCTNAGGTGYANNIPLQVVAPPAPVVNLSISPISITVGGSATITWSSTNNPTTCTAGGSWSGSKASSGSASTGTMSTVGNYTYTLTCSNSGGSNSASAGLTVSSGSTTTKPAVTISVSPTSIGTGSSATISWSVANSPTSCTASGDWSGSKAASGSTSTGTISSARTYTYTLSCSNSAGTGSGSVTLTAIATPGISISVSPTSITSGSSATITWNVTNSPTSCSAGGDWSGSKAASGSQTVAPTTARTYSYSLSCTNSGGTSTNSTTLVVNAQQVVYCNGKTPCYGPRDLASHNTSGNCWGYNLTWVINITNFAPRHPAGTGSGSLATPGSTCARDIHAILAGSQSISGYTDSAGSSRHGHLSTTVNNLSGSALSSYVTGYYDTNKP